MKLQTLKSVAQVALGMAILFWFFGGIITAFGALNELRMMKAAKSWPGAPGRIRVSYARHIQGPGIKNPYWKVEMAGNYLGGEGTFGVMRLGYGFGNNGGGSRRRTESAAKRYPAGMELTVYPEPGRPGWVILEPNAPARLTYIGLCAGVAGILLPVFLFFWGKLTGYRPSADEKP